MPKTLELARDHNGFDAQNDYVPGNTLTPAVCNAKPNRSSSGDQLEQGQKNGEHQSASALLNGDNRDHKEGGTHGDPVPVVTTNLDSDHHPCDAQQWSVAVQDQQQTPADDQSKLDAQDPPVDPAGALLLILADALDDIERTRIANENRLRSLTTVKGLADTDKAAVTLGGIVSVLADVEKQSTKALERAMKAHPLGPWVQCTVGVGLKQGARLIAAIGDPIWNTAEDRPRRGPAELWCYCGYAPGQKRTKGVKSNWNADAKMRAFLCAEGALKSGVRRLDGCDDSDGYDLNHREAISPLGQVYLDARTSWAEKETSDGHKHNHALRLVAKAILKDLFLEAKELDRRQGQRTFDAQTRDALPPVEVSA